MLDELRARPGRGAVEKEGWTRPEEGASAGAPGGPRAPSGPRRPAGPAGGVPKPPGPPRRRKAWTWKRALKWAAVGIAGWLAFSLVLFLVSAQLQAGDVETGGTLSDAGPMPFVANTILVLGSDARPKDTKEPGGVASGSRADSIMLLRLGGGHSSSLSIPATPSWTSGPASTRSTAYAFGGVPLTIRTVENYLGIDINHVMLVSFTNFPTSSTRWAASTTPAAA